MRESIGTDNSIQPGGISLTVLGTRDSMAVSTRDTMEYGGNTTCYLFETDEEAIIVDAGTGIMNLPDLGEKRLSLLITHPHIDHLMGFPMFLGGQQGKEITVYGDYRGKYTIRQQLERYLSYPLWPVTMDDYGVKLQFKDISEGTDFTCPESELAANVSAADTAENLITTAAVKSFAIGDVSISATPSNHPGGSTIFKLDYKGVFITVATDFEHQITSKDLAHQTTFNAAASQGVYSEEPLKSLAAFAQNSDLILYDAQFTPEEYEKCRGFGHSTYEKAIELQQMTGAKEMLLIHHDPNHTDAFIDELQRRVEAEGHEHIRFAKEGLKVSF